MAIELGQIEAIFAKSAARIGWSDRQAMMCKHMADTIAVAARQRAWA